MQLRHEVKHEINYGDYLILRQRLQAVCKPEPHAPNGIYHIRSLYLDTPDDKALLEKLNGASRREKFRIRYYNGDKSFIRLEKKIKIANLGTKLGTTLSEQTAKDILSGNLLPLLNSNDVLCNELYTRMVNEHLEPKTVVDYTREAFIFDAGNVRVTLDYDIRTGLKCTDFLNTQIPTVPIPDSPIILEVKWDNFLPSVIRDAVALTSRRETAFSKYAQCRNYD